MSLKRILLISVKDIDFYLIALDFPMSVYPVSENLTIYNMAFMNSFFKGIFNPSSV